MNPTQRASGESAAKDIATALLAAGSFHTLVSALRASRWAADVAWKWAFLVR
jgi:hypothetical protein